MFASRLPCRFALRAGLFAAVLALAWARPAAAQWPTDQIVPFADNPQSVYATDLDADGDTDVLSASNDDNRIAWYENDGTSNPSFTVRTITTNADGQSVFATDIDGDGDTDVLAGATRKIEWYENDGASDPSFTAHTIVSLDVGGLRSVFAADVDGDGDTDVLSAEDNHDEVRWYENDGNSNPSFTEHLITNTADGASSVYASDLDADGDTDVLSASSLDDTVAWYENDGATDPSFTTRDITTSKDGARSVFATDVDGDNDTDVLSASDNDGTIAWYESDGASNPSFTTRDIVTNAHAFDDVYARDVDGDGDTDIFSAAAFGGNIEWYDNDGSENFTTRTITTNADGTQSVYATDVDGDTDTDVLSATRADDEVAWYESDGASPPSFGLHTITTGTERPVSVYATDVDGDTDTDVLSASTNDDMIVWHKNDGGENFTTPTITTSANEARSVYAADLDGDSDTDVLSASFRDDKIAWYENDGASNPSFTTRVITTNAKSAQGVFATDVDGDGDTDVLSASGGFDENVTWYENNGASDPSFTAHPITSSAADAESVFATDVDGDGDTDVLSVSVGDDTVAWYENDGSENFTTRTITTSADGAFSVYATDVNRDGDTDVLSAANNDDEIAWYENDGTTDPSFTTRTITTNADGARSVFAKDLDEDGHTDVLSASFRDSDVVWYENDGTDVPSFTAHKIDDFVDGTESVFATDIDGNGDPDVVSGHGSATEIDWFENTLTPPLIVNDGSTDGFFPCDSSPDASDVSDGIGQASSGQDVQVCPGSYSESTLDVSREVELESGASLTISDQLTLSSKTLDAMAGSVTLTSTAEDASARISGSGSGSTSGDVTIERYVERKDGGAETSHWRLMASPLGGALDEETDGGKGEHDTYSGPPLLSNTWTQGANMDGANGQGSGVDPSVFFYDETADVGTDPQKGWSPVGDLAVPTTGTQIENQEGFAVFLFRDWDFDGTNENFPITLSVTGTVQGDENSGTDAPLPVSCTDNDGTGSDGCTDPNDGWNLVANPYVSHIDWTSGSFSKTALEANAYVYDADNGHYDQTDGTNGGDKFIAPFQAFFVKSNATNGNEGSVDLKVNSGAKADPGTSGDREFKSEAKRPLVSLQLSDETRAEETRLTFHKGADSGKDRYDGYQLTPLSGDYHLLASEIEGQAGTYDSQYRPLPAEDTLTVGLAVTTTSGGAYTIEADTLVDVPADLQVRVLDTQTGEVANLRNGESLGFTVGESSTASSEAASPRELLADGPVQKATSGGVITGRFNLQIIPSAAIPVELASFDATASDGEVDLEWETASETNNAGFAVERKTGGSAGWTEVGFVESKASGGTTTEAQTYRFTDETVPFEAEWLTYRLRQKDLDGSTSLSKKVTVQLGAPSKTKLHAPFPSPASRQVTLRYEAAEATDLQIGIYDVLGRRVRTVLDRRVDAGRHEQTVSVGDLPAGTYFLRMRAGGETRTRKVTVVR